MSQDSAARARKAAIQKLESLQGSGVQQVPRRRAKPATDTAKISEKTNHPAVAASAHPEAQKPAFDRTPAQRKLALERLCGEVEGCRLCPALVANRSRTVFGVGPTHPRLVFFGEAPGADEDKQGEPFVGRAGQLLNKIIEACTLRRSDVYILNVLKCRPPDNRAPEPEEISNCRPFFEQQLEILRPEFICCLGLSAAQSLLQTTLSLGKIRKSFHDWKGIRVLATYHPAYLLRNPPAKKDTWEDMQMLLSAMGISLPEKQ